MPEWIKKAITYAKDHVALTAILAGVVALLLVVIIVLIVKKSKNSKKRKAEALRLAEAKEKAEEEAKAKAEAEAKAKAEEESKQKVEEETKKAETAKKKAPAKTETKTTEAKPTAKAKTSATAKKSPAKAVESQPEISQDEDDELGSRYTGKWVICRVIVGDSDGKTSGETDESYFFELRASNGEKLLSSEEYTTYNGVLNGIKTHKENILRNNFKITLSKKGDYIFKLLSGKNTLLCMGENYKTRARCERAIESTKRFAQTAVIDENVQDQVIKLPVEDDGEVQPLAENSNGKWIISSNVGTDGEEVFYFELFANNGEKLLSSEEYTTYIGAVNGIGTHKTNIEKGNFRISLTKKGDYIYKLLSGNGQLLCLGEHYKTKRLCMNAVESVKRFALNSPVLTETEIAHEQI